jgi:hypothetical protein
MNRESGFEVNNLGFDSILSGAFIGKLGKNLLNFLTKRTKYR